MPSPFVALVTGGRSGIGLAMAKRMATWPDAVKILAVSRSINASHTQNDKIEPLAADVTSAEGRSKIVSRVKELCDGPNGAQLRYLVHNAGMIGDIKLVRDLTPEEFRGVMMCNVDGPIFLSAALVDYLEPKAAQDPPGRILHVGTGAAHGAPPVGWLSYGVTKAAFYQAYKYMEREFRETRDGKVLVGSFRPGVVATDMQGKIRESSSDDMPAVDVFKKMKENEYKPTSEDDHLKPHPPPADGGLDTPENVAHYAEFLLMRTSNEEYGKDEWDIRDKANYSRWCA